MTPYQLASDMFRTGISHDEVVSRLIATGLTPDDASTAAIAARHQQPASAAATAAEAPVKPGFHGWLLLATIAHGIYAAKTLQGLSLYALLLPSLVRSAKTAGELAVVVFWLFAFAGAAVFLATGVVLLLKRRRRARTFLMLWSAACLAIQLITFVFGDGALTSLVMPAFWLCYFWSSKQLRATLTN